MVELKRKEWTKATNEKKADATKTTTVPITKKTANAKYQTLFFHPISDSSVQHVHVLNDFGNGLIDVPVPAQSVSGAISTIQKCAQRHRPKCESGTSKFSHYLKAY